MRNQRLRGAVAFAAAVVAAAVSASAGGGALQQVDVCPTDSPNTRGAVNLAIEPHVLATTWSDGSVALAIPLRNRGSRAATDVVVQSLAAGSASYLGPQAFPFGAGTIGPRAFTQLNARFSGSPQLADGRRYPVTARGTYRVGVTRCQFAVQAFAEPAPPASDGRPIETAVAQTFTAATAAFPAAPLPGRVGLPNPDRNNILLPLGQPRFLDAFDSLLRPLNDTLGFDPSELAPPPGDPNAVVVLRNRSAATTQNVIPPDPSVGGATPSGFVLATANAPLASFSTDYGATFTTVPLQQVNGFSDPGNPARTDFFPEDDAGLCCDQVTIYVPGHNLMVWLLQYRAPVFTNLDGNQITLNNRLRIAFATPEAAAADFFNAWTWFDITGAMLRLPFTDWLDYPDLAYSDDLLYIGIDHVQVDMSVTPPNTGSVPNDRRFFIRASLDDMAGGQGQVNLSWYEHVVPGVNLAKTHFAQSSPNTMYYVGRRDTSTLVAYALHDSSMTVPTGVEVPVSSYCADAAVRACDFSSTAPDSLDWNQAPHNIQGGTYVAPTVLCPPEGCAGPTRFVYFAFDGGRDTANERPHPYIRVVKLDADSLALVDEIDVWNPDFAFATAALVWRPGSGKDEVAITAARGGGNRGYVDNVVGFLHDPVLYRTTTSDVTQTIMDAAGSIVVRYGDYFNVRNAAGPMTQAGQGVGYSTLSYSVTRNAAGLSCTAAGGGCTATLRYVLFGRHAELYPSPGPIIR